MTRGGRWSVYARLFSSLEDREARIGCMKAFCWILLLSSLCPAQELTVRVLNAHNRAPLAKQTVTVQYLNERPAGASSPLSLQTDSHGEVRFSVPSPLPATVDVKVALTSEHWHCACWVMVEAGKVLREGVAQAAPSKSGKAIKDITSQPGEVIIMARPFTFGETLLYPFVKD